MKLSLEELSEILEKSTLRYFILSFANYVYNCGDKGLGGLTINTDRFILFGILFFNNGCERFALERDKPDINTRIKIKEYINIAINLKPKEIAEILNLLFQDFKNGEQLASVTATGPGIFTVTVHRDVRTSFIFQYIIRHSSPIE